jgi:RNA polymerase sporulation-specific sigma factor
MKEVILLNTIQEEAFMQEHENLVHYILKKHFPYYRFDEDIIQEARIGMFGAMRRFDSNRGVKFTTYAYPSILGAVRKHFRKTRKTLSTCSLDTTLNGSTDTTFEDLMSDGFCLEDNVTEKVYAQSNLINLMDGLTDRERKIVQLRLSGKSQKAVGQTMNTSQTSISRSLKKISKAYKEQSAVRGCEDEAPYPLDSISV